MYEWLRIFIFNLNQLNNCFLLIDMKYIALALLGLVSVQAIKVETSIAQYEQNKELEFAEMSDDSD